MKFRLKLAAKLFAPEQCAVGAAITFTGITVMFLIGFVRLQFFEQCTPESLDRRSAAKPR